jgi:hypothetical protein
MRTIKGQNKQDRLVAEVSRLWKHEPDRILVASAIQALDTRYGLNNKIVNESGVEDVVKQMFGRLANAFGSLSNMRGKIILDIACGSNTSKAPAMAYINTPFGEMTVGRTKDGYSAMFEPWFCRILFELGADAVGIDFGDLEGELFTHYRVDLGQIGVLNFLPDRSFDAVQDSRLFGSPEFTAQFQNRSDHIKIAQEIRHQERRVLKAEGIVIHSDAEALLV